MFACVKCARCGVVYTTPVAYKGIAVACERIFIEKQTNNTTKCAHYSCHPVDDHQVVEDDDHDSENGHHIQPVFGSTGSATSCSGAA